MIHKSPGAYLLTSYNPAYPPRFVPASEVQHVHRVAYVRTLK
ncbi:MAG TPA: hypothetical protein VF198_12085 [Vicinamibacterales bacterium]